MRPTSPTWRYLFVLAVLAIIVVICGLLWRFVLAPSPTPTPTKAPIANRTPAELPTATKSPLTPSPFTPAPTVTLTPAPVRRPTADVHAQTLSVGAPGMYIGYDQLRHVANETESARGSHFFIGWREIEDSSRGLYNWDAIDGELEKLAADKQVILRVVVRCPDNSAGTRDGRIPIFTLAEIGS